MPGLFFFTVWGAAPNPSTPPTGFLPEALDLSEVCFFSIWNVAPNSLCPSGRPHEYRFSCCPPRSRRGPAFACYFPAMESNQRLPGFPRTPRARVGLLAPHPRCGGRLCWCAPIRTLGKCRRWSMDKQNAQRHLSLRDSLGLSPTGSIMGPPGRRQPARRLANVSALRRKDHAAPTRRGPRTSK